MSWFKKNYDKVVIGVSLAALAGVAATTLMGSPATLPNTVKGVKEKEEYPWPDTVAKTDGITEKTKTPQGAVWVPVKISESQVARLFLGPALVQKAGEEEPFDALDPASPKLRGEVPNHWIIENGLDITRSKILERDEDGDKYTNGEEYTGGSNPRDANSRPSMVLKLKLVEIVSLKSELKFTVSGNEMQFKRVQETEPGKEASKNNFNAPVGQNIFPDEPRYKLEAIEDGKASDGKVIKVARVADSVITAYSPFTLNEGEVKNRPTFLAKIVCNFDGTEEIVAREGDGLPFKALGTTSIKLVKIDPVANTVDIEFTEGSAGVQKHQIKKN